MCLIGASIALRARALSARAREGFASASRCVIESASMASFNPNHKWLSIPPQEQPPNHSRLLELANFEIHVDVIESAIKTN